MSELTAQTPSEVTGGLNERLNKLRAGVLGANDGIVSTAAVIVGVAGASSDIRAIATAGIAAVVGGAISMALGEYVSVSSQRDAENAIIEKEKRLHSEDPDGEFEVLVQEYEKKGISRETAEQVAREATAHNPLATHLEMHYGIDQSDIVSPWSAAVSSFIAFFLGAMLPMLAILFPSDTWRVPFVFFVTLVALAITGVISARLGGANQGKAAVRLVIGGALALVLTWAVGWLFGTTVM
ncbi:VIT1/CCC1 transporter family protein [Corynebacterium lubricantis]|uniref:VIT1/CCC1 transporter family protein n=1 Tax=Corynebacterium lubricantis TaxID=541095 RepID=UPI000376D259|nr:VIT family protein [Corynebacterium lubricantis]